MVLSAFDFLSWEWSFRGSSPPVDQGPFHGGCVGMWFWMFLFGCRGWRHGNIGGLLDVNAQAILGRRIWA